MPLSFTPRFLAAICSTCPIASWRIIGLCPSREIRSPHEIHSRFGPRARRGARSIDRSIDRSETLCSACSAMNPPRGNGFAAGRFFSIVVDFWVDDRETFDRDESFRLNPRFRKLCVWKFCSGNWHVIRLRINLSAYFSARHSFRSSATVDRRIPFKNALRIVDQDREYRVATRVTGGWGEFDRSLVPKIRDWNVYIKSKMYITRTK